MAVTVSLNIWWIAANRRGMPFDIDEAGYLERAVTDGDILRRHGLGALLSHVRGPDPQAPLLPVTAGVVHAVAGSGPVGLLVTQQAFFALLLVATYAVACRLGGRTQALVATVFVAACPGILDGARSFSFGLVAAAMFMVALAVQLWAGEFDRWPRGVAWGVALGIAALARTMMLGILPGLVLAALLRVSGAGSRARRFGALLLGLVVAAAVAWSWYSASWHAVMQYLTGYGYGSASRGYGHAYPVWSVAWWTVRPGEVISTALLVPMTLAVAACLGFGAVGAVRRWVASPPADPADPAERRASAVVRRLGSRLCTDRGTVVVVALWSFLALSSTANIGSGFVFVLVPPLVVLAVSAASGAMPRGRNTRAFLVTAAAAIAAASFVADSWPVGTSGPVTIHMAGWVVPLVDNQGTLRGLITEDAPGGTRPTAAVDAELRAEQRALVAVSTLVIHGLTSSTSGTRTVLLSTSDWFVNVNSIGLDVLERTGSAPPTGLLYSPDPAGRTLDQQLSGPSAPAVVVVGENSSLPDIGNYLTVDRPSQVPPLLTPDGFHRLGAVTLPDGRVLAVWSR